MAEPAAEPEGPEVRQSRVVSLVWLVPIVAVALGLWLVWDAW